MNLKRFSVPAVSPSSAWTFSAGILAAWIVDLLLPSTKFTTNIYDVDAEQRFQLSEAAKVTFKPKSVPFSFSACFLAV